MRRKNITEKLQRMLWLPISLLLMFIGQSANAQESAPYVTKDNVTYSYKDGCGRIESMVDKTQTSVSLQREVTFEGVGTVTITKIGVNAFLRSNLESITIPKEITLIGGGAFQECQNLKSINFEEDSELNEIKSSAFYMISHKDRGNCGKIILPKKLKIIGDTLFPICV